MAEYMMLHYFLKWYDSILKKSHLFTPPRIVQENGAGRNFLDIE